MLNDKTLTKENTSVVSKSEGEGGVISYALILETQTASLDFTSRERLNLLRPAFCLKRISRSFPAKKKKRLALVQHNHRNPVNRVEFKEFKA
ncbi:MAG: hypothetical protein R2830_17370 [Saprospiraceae bacterium]